MRGTQPPALAQDAEVARLLATPWTELPAMRAAFDALVAAWVPQADRRGVFAVAYREQTAAIHAAKHTMRDPAWVDTFSLAFGEAWRVALHTWSAGHRRHTPAPWRLALDAGAAGRTVVLQDLLLGMNAHITYDLPVVMCRLLPKVDASVCLGDFRRLLLVIRQSIDGIQDRVAEAYAPGLKRLDRAVGRVDEWMTVLAVGIQRELVFRMARRADTPHRAEHLRRRANALALLIGHGVLTPTRVPGVRRAWTRIEGSRVDGRPGRR